VVLSGSGYRRERKGSPLANSWRQYADAFGMPCVLVQNGGGEPPRPDVVVVDLSPLRDARGDSHAGVRDACVQLAVPLRASLTRDDTAVDASAAAAAEEGEPAAFLEDGAIWKLRPVALEFTCVDRPSAKALAEAFSAALCGAAPVGSATASSSKRRAEPQADEDDADAPAVL
jgi:hypothetical protein